MPDTHTRTQHRAWANLPWPTYGIEIAEGEDQGVGYVYGQDAPSQRRADLWIAAPDLLAALEAATEYLDPRTTWPTPTHKAIMAQASAAIRKARGEE